MNTLSCEICGTTLATIKRQWFDEALRGRVESLSGNRFGAIVNDGRRDRFYCPNHIGAIEIDFDAQLVS